MHIGKGKMVSDPRSPMAEVLGLAIEWLQRLRHLGVNVPFSQIEIVLWNGRTRTHCLMLDRRGHG